MQEYRIVDDNHGKSDSKKQLEDYVVCKIYKKDNSVHPQASSSSQAESENIVQQAAMQHIFPTFPNHEYYRHHPFPPPLPPPYQPNYTPLSPGHSVMFTYHPSTVFNHEPYAVVPSPGSYFIPPSMHYPGQPYPPLYRHNPWEQPSYGPVPPMNFTVILPVAPPPPQCENCDVPQ
ncbi:hypothetical protein L6452_24745 [Arctium lappa]|uniref:Uncharacterized protein n=1 Tax=Arctium lappa TaxID=4217 RepID=A0ACB9AE94_ARCLA|nr:hypothetical protein L6452_24745 [Arctium lappa]